MTPVLLLSAVLAADPVPVITTVVGTGTKGYTGDSGLAVRAKLDNPFDVAFDKAGHLYLSDTNNHVVRRVDRMIGTITTVAGTGNKGFGTGRATQAELNEPYGIELDADFNLFIVDRLNYRVCRVDGNSGELKTLAGTGKSGYSGDGGPADRALLAEPNGICLDGKGTLYIADVKGQRVRAVDLKTGLIRTAVGTGKKANEGDGGPVEKASLNGPRAVAVDAQGRLYIVEREGHGVRRVDFTKNTIERFAGTGKKGYTGDGGPALAATFDGPKEIDIDKDGNVYIVDTENEAIRRIDAKTGVVTTAAGKGRSKTPGQGDDGPATAATLGRPHGVAVGPDGAVYIGDTLSHRIRRVK